MIVELSQGSKATISKSRSQSLSFYSQKFAILPAKTCNKVTWKLRKTHENEKLLLEANDSKITYGPLSDNFLITIVSWIPWKKTD